VEFTRLCGAALATTVPSFVTPCTVHSQNPPTGMAVGQVKFSAWQLLASAGLLAIAPKARTTTLMAWEHRMETILSFHE
jgi:hypothetical protein